MKGTQKGASIRLEKSIAILILCVIVGLYIVGSTFRTTFVDIFEYSPTSASNLHTETSGLSKKHNKLVNSVLREKILQYSKDDFIIITICNKGMAAEWLQQWYVSAKRAGIHNLLVIATDAQAYRWAQERVGNRAISVDQITPLLNSTRWKGMQGISESKERGGKAFTWRSGGYESIVIQRATILKSVLVEGGVNILYSDTDVHWLRNPSEIISTKYAKYNICLQREKGDEVGDYNCSGIIFLQNLNITAAFLDTWEMYIKKRLLRKGFFTDQEEVNHLLSDLKTRRRRAEIDEKLFTGNFSACTFDWDEFPSGINYFSARQRGRGKIEKTCRSKICRTTVWKPIQYFQKDLRVRGRAYLVHHNYAKNNQIKKDRAKQFGLWLELREDDWS